MKLLLILMVLIAGNCIGQTEKEALKKAKNYLNYKITYAVLVERYKVNAVTKEQLDAATNKMKDVAINNVGDYNTLAGILGTIQLSAASQNITTLIDSINVDQFANLMPEEAANAITTRAFDLLKINYNAIYGTIAAEKEDANTNVKNYLIDNSPTPPKPTGPDGPIIVPHPQTYTMLNLILNIISILGIIAVFYYFYRQNFKMQTILQRLHHSNENTRDIISRYTKDGANASSGKDVYNTPINMADIEKAILTNSWIQGMADELAALKNQQTQPIKANKPAYEKPIQKMEKTTEAEIFYMTGPVNNYFPTAAKSMRKEDTVYKFIISANRQEATFEIHTAGAPVNEIVKRNESYLKPACEEENLPDNNTKNIITIKKGNAVLEGDKWVIKTKAVIRYE